MYLCARCARKFRDSAFGRKDPEHVGVTLAGYCLNCNRLLQVRLHQWFLCGVCDRVVRSIGRSVVADQFVLDWWQADVQAAFPRLRLTLVDEPELRARNRADALEKVASIDFQCEDMRSGKPLFGIELKTGRSYIRGRSIGTKMNQFQLDHGDVNDILAVVERNNLPVYLFHAQVMDRAEPPTIHYVGLGLWWTDLYSMQDHYLGSARRPREAKTAAYYDTRMFLEAEDFIEHLRVGGPRIVYERLRRQGIPTLYEG